MLLSMLLLACTPPPTAPAPPPTAEIQLDYGPLYGGLSSMGLVDRRLITPELLQRVQLEAGALSAMRPDASVEPWLRRALLAALSDRGAVIVGPSPPDGAPVTLLLRDLHFGAGTDTVEVVVRPDADHSDRYLIGIRQFSDEASLCPEVLSVEVPYIALHATAQRAADGAVVAIWHEVILPEIDLARAVRAARVSPDQLCEAVSDLAARDEALQPNGEEYERAAQELVRIALLPFAAGG